MKTPRHCQGNFNIVNVFLGGTRTTKCFIFAPRFRHSSQRTYGPKRSPIPKKQAQLMRDDWAAIKTDICHTHQVHYPHSPIHHITTWVDADRYKEGEEIKMTVKCQPAVTDEELFLFGSNGLNRSVFALQICPSLLKVESHDKRKMTKLFISAPRQRRGAGVCVLKIRLKKVLSA